MYKIDILINYKWKYLCESDNIYVIDKIVYKTLEEGYQIRVLKDNVLITFLNSIEEYDYWLMLINKKVR